MGEHITRYKTENGKTRKVKNPAAKQAEKNTALEAPSGSNSKDNKPDSTAK